jgi:hypothetical protein
MKTRNYFSRNLSAIGFILGGLLLCLTIVGAIVGLPAIVVGAIIGKKKTTTAKCRRCGEMSLQA